MRAAHRAPLRVPLDLTVVLVVIAFCFAVLVGAGAW